MGAAGDDADLLRPLLLRRGDLLRDGWTERRIDDASAEGLHQIRRGWYMASSDWTPLMPERRHLAHILAVAQDMTGSGVVSHASAAVVWGLPLYKATPARVHVTTAPGARVSSGVDVMRHLCALPKGDAVTHGGVRVTSLDRTVFDCVRMLAPEAAVCVADAAERIMGGADRRRDPDAVAAWRAQLIRRVSRAAGARGIRRARWVLEFSDGRAQLPGESVSRLQLMRAGFRDIDLQVHVPGPDGRDFFVDFLLRRERVIGEFDGKAKYLSEELRGDQSAEEVLLAEKKREDWIRGTTQHRFVRWGFEHISTPQRLAEHLAACGIRPAR